MRLKQVAGYRTPDRKFTRLVFELTPTVYAVVKTFSTESTGRPRTVKIWDLATSSLAKTVSYWSTNEEFSPSPEDWMEAEGTLRSLATALR